MEDMISRKMAIEALLKEFERDTPKAIRAKLTLENLPSAQPEKRTEERTKTHACDLISRQAAIDALDKRFDSIPMEQTTEILLLRKDLRALPSEQPEPCEDTISRKAAIDALTRKMVSIPTAGEKDLMGDVNRIRTEDISVIRRLPSAQPEIVRCKECVYADENYHCDYMTTWNYGDCFCSYGKRRIDG